MKSFELITNTFIPNSKTSNQNRNFFNKRNQKDISIAVGKTRFEKLKQLKKNIPYCFNNGIYYRKDIFSRFQPGVQH